MKKYLIIFAAILALCLAACGTEQPDPDAAMPEYTVSPAVTAPVSPEAPDFEPLYFAEGEIAETVEHSYGSASIRLSLPEGWYYEKHEWNDELQSYGIDFWPAGAGDARLRLEYYNGQFAVCGTGLAETEGSLPGIGALRMGYFDGSEYWTFVSFYDSPGDYALMAEGNILATHGEEAAKILSSIVLDEGQLRRSEVAAITEPVYDGSYDYMRVSFAPESARWTVDFVRMGKGEALHTVVLDETGEDITEICGYPLYNGE